jgi:hypothetical protein
VREASRDIETTIYLSENPLKTTLLDSASFEHYGFHGVSGDINTLTRFGFIDRGLNKLKGTFFAENSNVSDQYIACPVCKQGSVYSEGNLRIFSYLPCQGPCRCPDNNTTRKVVIARMLLGNSSLVEHVEDIPEEVTTDSVIIYSIPRQFILFQDTRAYPEFVVEYTRVTR